MAVTAHYVTDDTINAFATLGGHLMVYQGLMRRMPGENALANVIGHEIGQVKLRHPVSSMGRGLVIGVALSLVSAAGGAEVVSAALDPAGLLAVTKFSRDQEWAADAERLSALVRAYRHVNGAAETCRWLRDATRDMPQPPAIFQHPPPGRRTHRGDREQDTIEWMAGERQHRYLFGRSREDSGGGDADKRGTRGYIPCPLKHRPSTVTSP